MKALTTEIAVIKTEMKNLSNKMDESIKQNSTQHTEMFAFFKEEMAELHNALDRKAGKWVEKVIVGSGSVIGTGLLLALLGQIIK